MATKNDLIEAQNFSRRRLLTAFVSGAPGGKELQPATPLRALVVAVALTAAVILASVFYGFVQPGLPSGWQNNRLIIAKDTGARYVTVNGTLHPVINTVSARLLIPTGEFTVIATTQKSLATLPLGSTLGIVGAPDELPAPDSLVVNGWTACVTESGATAVRIGADTREASTRAVVASSNDRLYVIDGNRRYSVAADQTDAVLRAAGLGSLTPVPVSAAWLDLFSPGTQLAPIVVTNAGNPLAGADLTVGEVIHITGNPNEQRFLLGNDGGLVKLSPLAWQLYQLGSGRNTGQVQDVTASQVGKLQNSPTSVGGSDWPSNGFTGIAADQRPCALLQHDSSGRPQTVLATQAQTQKVTAGVRVSAGHGSLVLAGGSGAQNSSMLTLIDATGTAYALPGAGAGTVTQLGYTATDVGTVETAWIRLLPSGPALSAAAAGRSPGTAQGSG